MHQYQLPFNQYEDPEVELNFNDSDNTHCLNASGLEQAIRDLCTIPIPPEMAGLKTGDAVELEFSDSYEDLLFTRRQFLTLRNHES